MRLTVIPFVALASLCLASCQGGVSFESNLDPNNVIDYLKPGSLEEVTYQELGDRPYISKGFVAGLSCQVKERDFIANETDARNDARNKAVELGANAIVFNKCIRVQKTEACLESVTCYADALFVKEEDAK